MRTGLSLIQYVGSCDNCIFYADLIYLIIWEEEVETLSSAWQPPLFCLHFSSIKKLAALYVNKMSYIFHFEKIYPWCFDAERLPHDIFSLLLRYCSFDFIVFSWGSFNNGENKNITKETKDQIVITGDIITFTNWPSVMERLLGGKRVFMLTFSW